MRVLRVPAITLPVVAAVALGVGAVWTTSSVELHLTKSAVTSDAAGASAQAAAGSGTDSGAGSAAEAANAPRGHEPPSVDDLREATRRAAPVKIRELPVQIVALPASKPAPVDPNAAAAAVQQALVGHGDSMPDAATGIPATVLAAYHRAEDSIAGSDPSCHLPWWVLAGIGRIESGHASGGRVDANGTTRGRILGVRLDGSLAGTAVIKDSDGGRWDGDAQFDRAVGPMQFLPGTWNRWGRDGNGDGVIDPNNVFDATLGAGTMLCANGGDLAEPANLARAILSYNYSQDYLNAVMSWGIRYRDSATPSADSPLDVPTAPVTPVPTPAPTPSATPTTAPTAPASPKPSPTTTKPPTKPPTSPTPTPPPTTPTTPPPTTPTTPPPTTPTTTPPTTPTTPPPTTSTTAAPAAPAGSPTTAAASTAGVTTGTTAAAAADQAPAAAPESAPAQ